MRSAQSGTKRTSQEFFDIGKSIVLKDALSQVSGNLVNSKVLHPTNSKD